MKNPATNKPSRDELNAFTQWLYDAIKSGQRKPVVRLRNGSTVELTWFNSDGPEYEHFASVGTDRYMVWNKDGTSVTSAALDIMETV